MYYNTTKLQELGVELFETKVSIIVENFLF